VLAAIKGSTGGFPCRSPEMKAFRQFCLDKGLFLYTHWHTVLVIPPLIITEEELAEGFEILDAALEITDEGAR